uniref:F-box domain-containing protein n=1 Tax=Chenopodium quinoa TaxID=63459 RepID=A0A803LEW3_CHEQI
MAREVMSNVKNTTRINNLPDESIATVISFTTPRDACRVATLSTTFSVVANSNIVWNHFLPSDYREIILRPSNVDHVLLLDTLSRRTSLCISLIILFSLTKDWWFAEVARLLYVWWFEIKGKITTSMLSPNTKYGAYLVFHVTSSAWNFYDYPIEAVIETSGGQVVTGRVYLDPRRGGIVDEDYELVPLSGAEEPEEGLLSF